MCPALRRHPEGHIALELAGGSDNSHRAGGRAGQATLTALWGVNAGRKRFTFGESVEGYLKGRSTTQARLTLLKTAGGSRAVEISLSVDKQTGFWICPVRAAGKAVDDYVMPA
jgi:hypothetical protein